MSAIPTAIPTLTNDDTLIEHIVQMQMTDAVFRMRDTAVNTLAKGLAAMKEMGIEVTDEFYENAAYFFEEVFHRTLNQLRTEMGLTQLSRKVTRKYSPDVTIKEFK
jgi:hypothetical protein